MEFLIFNHLSNLKKKNGNFIWFNSVDLNIIFVQIMFKHKYFDRLGGWHKCDKKLVTKKRGSFGVYRNLKNTRLI